MGKRKCPQNKQQHGVCGCPSFWRRSKANSMSNVKDSSAASTKFSSVTAVLDGDLHQRKRQKRGHSVLSQEGGIGLARPKLSGHMDSKFRVGSQSRQKQNVSKMNTRSQENASVEEKKKKKKKMAKVNTPVRILVDYDLPTSAERLDWDTDEVRRMVGEIEGGRYRA